MNTYTAHDKLRVTSGKSDIVLIHHGTDGMKWGRRKYQYEDGSLTPLGRIHYGVGEARAKAKIKMREQKNAAKLERKRIKAEGKAAAELERARIKAEGEAKRDIEKARTETEIAKQREEYKAMRESNKAEIEAEKAYGKEVTKQKKLELESERKFQKDNINAAKEQAVKQDKNDYSKAKVILGVAAAAGIGYLLYRACRSGSVIRHAGAGQGVINANATRPVSELLSVNSKTVAEATTSKAKKARVGLATRFKNWQAKQLAARDKISLEEAIERLKHSEDAMDGLVLIHSDSNELYHWGIPGMRWGIRRYQNPDGTLTDLGKQHYGVGGKAHSKLDKAIDKVEKKIDKSTRVQRNAAAYLRRPYQDADVHNYMVNAFEGNRTKAWKNYKLEKDLLAVRGERPVSKENDPDNPYSDDRNVIKKGTLLNSVSENFVSSDNYLKNKRAMYLYKDKEDWDNKIYKGPFAEYLIGRNGYVGINRAPITQFIKEHKFKTVKDLTMPTQQQKIDAFKEMLNDKRLKKDLQDVQKRILAINYDPARKEKIAKLDVNNIKTDDDLKAAYEVFNHCMEDTGRYKSAAKYLKKMSKSYDAMTDDNNRGVYNSAVDPIIVFKASKVLEKHGDTNLKDFLNMDEIMNNTEEIRKKNGKVSF